MRRRGNWHAEIQLANECASNVAEILVHRLVALLIVLLCGFDTCLAQTAGRIQLQLNTSEADAVLAILQKKAARQPLSDDDWKQLFATGRAKVTAPCCL
jgi:hypothetical protein